MNLFTNPKDIQIGDVVCYEYDEDKIAHGTCTNLSDDLIEVNYTTEGSTEQKIDQFQKGFWIKQML